MSPELIPDYISGDSPPLFPRLSVSQVRQISPAALAYLGDSVYELYVRRQCLLPLSRLRDYHHQVVTHVRAEAQAQYLESLLPHLTPSELEMVRQGRNAASGGPKRIHPDLYQQATGLEALLGYLYLTNSARLGELLHLLNLY